MRLSLPLIVAASAMLLVAPAYAAKIAPADDAAARKEVQAMFASYSAPTPEDGSEAEGSDLPDYSKATEALIAQWRGVINIDELTPLQDFGWLCQCQDFDNTTAKLISVALKPVAKGRIDAKTVFTPGWKETDKLRIRLVKEDGRWLVENLYFDGGGDLVTMLKREITEAKAGQ